MLFVFVFVFCYVLSCLRNRRGPFTTLAVFAITFYRYAISPSKPRCCIYEHTCSEYALEMLKTHPLPKAMFFSLKRLLSCHPFAHPKLQQECTRKTFNKHLSK
ncbi:membrane protein insertion efficiency factor YidD [Neorickettsia sp. 179522]|uniref:membrane protein insertion efficiency factor YidD n=1 Tax=Neorickettsia sp. 179522 TaxID=1714371 RepID=UPI001E3BD7F3|nr:membrane protein insertion efficiency factor YidD [Neorickettsia sp. 179522]